MNLTRCLTSEPPDGYAYAQALAGGVQAPGKGATPRDLVNQKKDLRTVITNQERETFGSLINNEEANE